MMLPDYETLDYNLQLVGASFAAAGSHGVICGVLATNATVVSETWLREIITYESSADSPYVECKRSLLELYDATREQLNDVELGFELFLPNDDIVSLTQRVVALTQWCEGFMLGVGLAGLKADDSLPKDCAEILKDISEIIRANANGADDEQDATSYVEIVEYLRISVMLIHEEMQPIKAPLCSRNT